MHVVEERYTLQFCEDVYFLLRVTGACFLSPSLYMTCISQNIGMNIFCSLTTIVCVILEYGVDAAILIVFHSIFDIRIIYGVIRIR